MDPLQQLDAYLSSEDSPENTMLLSDLDGFLTAFACTPEAIPEERWMPVALAEPAAVPEDMKNLVRARLAEIAEALIDQAGPIEPVFWQAKEGHVIAMDWCEGFMDGVKLAPAAWKALMQTDEGAELMHPILLHILDDNGNSSYGLAQEKLDHALAKAADAIPSAMPRLYVLLRQQAAARV